MSEAAVQEAPVRPAPSDRHIDLLQQLLDETGDNAEQALAAALALGRLFGGLRAQSHFAVKTALGAFQSGMPSSLVFNFRPQLGKKDGQRAEARVILGDEWELVVDLHEKVKG